MFSIDGIVSGFDTTSVIESLLGFQQAQIDKFNSRKAEIAVKQSSYKGIEAQVLTLQSSLSQLNRTQSSVFDVNLATSSDEDILTVAADGSATSGTYQMTVESLAAAQQLGSQGFSSTTETIATGDITFKVGDRAEQTITIDQSNNTLKGMVTTINDQLTDVNASVIYDQGAGSHRILLTSKHTGADNVITVTSAQDGGTGSIADFSGTPIQEAANAVLTLGSGPGAITASYASNQIEELIDGVTLSLNSAVPGTKVTVEVAADVTAAQEAIEGFVSDFNSVIEFIDNQTRYTPETEQASPLLGDRSVSTLKNRLLSAVSDTVTTTSGVSRLSQIGVDLNEKGKLVIDSGKLTDALNGDLEGVDPKDIRNLFGLNGVSSNAGIEFLTGGIRTLDSKTPYEVDITQAAERATITATNALAGSVDIDDTNNTVQITLDGTVSESLTLANGTYTPEELASHLQNTINNSETLGVHDVIVTVSGSNELSITSEVYGANSQLASVSGTSASTLGFDGTESDSGQDVAGVFIVDGVEEIGKGSGRVLIGDTDNENTADLQVRVTLTSGQVAAGVDGTISLSRGVSGRLDTYISKIVDGETGLLKSADDEFKSKIDSIDESIKRVEEITESKRTYLIAEFTALESILSELQNTGSFISSQLNSLSAFNSKSK
ncbi:MAG: flagellar filament capping protein FliD [Pirellulaceae bacterium]|nr:flagellar filament capping protein FliD [Pirellulaceae bacterium]